MAISTQNKFNWMDAMMADHRLDAMTRVVGYWIAQCVNREHGNAFVSSRTLADKAGVSIRSVADGRKALHAVGWISWKRTGSANIYCLLDGQMACVAERQKGLKAARDSDRNTSRDVQTLADPKAVLHHAANRDVQTLADLDVQTSADLDVQTLAHIPCSNVPVECPGSKEENSITMISQMELIQSDFEEWYRQYPKRVGKLKAEKTYIAVIGKKRATREQLLAGAMRYASERIGQDPKFTKHPTSWLNAGSWDDEPSPTKFKANDSILAGLQSYCEER